MPAPYQKNGVSPPDRRTNSDSVAESLPEGESLSVDPADFVSMGKATPFEGWKVCGKCIATVCNGKMVYTSL